ncbi:MAG: hypothetical protein SFX74_03100 [Fimbriimonadaceae bacterium]|nr:hypothetical protein [Fimbriimonadaceae bacterium]
MPLPLHAREAAPADRVDFSPSGTDLTPASDWLRRRAKLFEAGDYPDKGVCVTAEAIATLATNFTSPVPILIEHADSPFQLGLLVEVEAIGSELFGTLSLSPEANALIERSGAGALSLGITRDLSEIREVSLVKHPRVESARLFHHDLYRFWADAVDPVDFRAAYEQLCAERARELAEARLQRYLQEGRVTPLQSDIARTLLQDGPSVTFGRREIRVSELFAEFLRLNPAHAMFREWTPTPTDFSECLMLPEEAAFYRTHFPDVPLESIAAQRVGPSRNPARSRIGSESGG